MNFISLTLHSATPANKKRQQLMAARIYNTIVLYHRDLSFIVYEKEVRHLTFRMKRNNFDTVEISMPRGTSQSHLIQLIDLNYNKILNLRAKTAEKEQNRLAPPTEESIRHLQRTIEQLAPEIERAMNVKANKYVIKYMTSRWGSCRPDTHDITINAALSSLPRQFTEYVIVHELAHIFQPNHSKAFWSIVETYCPNYLRLRSQLKKYII